MLICGKEFNIIGIEEASKPRLLKSIPIQQVESKKLNAEWILDISHIPTGIYMIQISPKMVYSP